MELVRRENLSLMRLASVREFARDSRGGNWMIDVSMSPNWTVRLIQATSFRSLGTVAMRRVRSRQADVTRLIQRLIAVGLAAPSC